MRLEHFHQGVDRNGRHVSFDNDIYGKDSAMQTNDNKGRLFDLTFDIESLCDMVSDMVKKLPENQEGVKRLLEIRDTILVSVAKLQHVRPEELVVRLEAARNMEKNGDR